VAIQQLGTLVTNLRMEIGHSTNAATGINLRDQLVYIINRTEEELALEFSWPQLRVDRDVLISLGARYYAYPSDLPFEMIERAWLIYNTLYAEIEYGIGPEQFALFNSNVGFTSWPVQRWMHNYDTNTYELWPVPNQAPAATPTSQAALIRFRGTRMPTPMVNDSDNCTLDATAILLFAAAEYLARAKAEEASSRLDKAKNYLRQARARQSSNKQRPFVMGGGHGANFGPRIGLDYIPQGYGKGPNG
jgi:hypothetical protein